MLKLHPPQLPEVPPEAAVEESSSLASRYEPASVGSTASGERDCGDQLTAGLSADRHRREERLRQLLIGLRRAHSLGENARWVCVAAGLTELLWIVLSVNCGPTLLSRYDALRWLEQTLPLGAGGLLSTGALLALSAGVFRRRLLVQADREAVDLPPPRELGTADLPRPRADVQTREGRTTVLQHRVDLTDAWGRLARATALNEGYTLLVAFPLFLMNQNRPQYPGWIDDLLSFASIPPMMFVLLSPIPAIVSVFTWWHGRRLLRKAALEGLDVEDPTRNPWS